MRKPPPKAIPTRAQLPRERGSIGNHTALITMANPADSAAPLLTPMSPGSASGLRKMPCINVPAMPSPAPAARPRTRRGRRMLMKTRCSGVGSTPGCPPPATLASTRSSCGVLIAYAPEVAPSTSAQASSSAPRVNVARGDSRWRFALIWRGSAGTVLPRPVACAARNRSAATHPASPARVCGRPASVPVRAVARSVLRRHGLRCFACWSG